MAIPEISIVNTVSDCPVSFEESCSQNANDSGLVSFDIGLLPSYISIVSCSLSCLGSLLILVAYFTVKGIRNTAQKIITLLSIADFFTAFGYLMAAWNFLTHYNVHDEQRCKNVFQTVCDIQSFITTWSSMSSFWWTCALALHFYLILSPRKTLTSKMLPLENIIGWIVPLIIVFPMLVTGKLGYAPYATSNWCFIKENDYHQALKARDTIIFYILIAGKLWEVLSYIFVIVMYTLTTRRFHKQLYHKLHVQHYTGYAAAEDTRNEVKQRLLLIPLVFLMLRIWGTIQFFYSLGVSGQNQNGCIPKVTHNVYFALGIFQAIGDGGQGWGNALLYVLLSPTIRTQVLWDPCSRLFTVMADKYSNIMRVPTTVQSHTMAKVEANNLDKEAAAVSTEHTGLRDSQ